MTRFADSARPPECGAASLFLVTLLLMSAGLLVMYAARVTLTEQRLTANDVLAHEAHAAAQAGLEVAFAGIQRFDPADVAFDTDGYFVIEGPAATLVNEARFATRLYNHGLTPRDTALLRVESQGIASDGIGMRLMQQLVRRNPWLAHPPPAPLVVRGDVVLADDGILRNPSRPYAIWSGGGVVAPGAVLIEITGTAPCPNPGVCDSDARLAGLSPGAFFSNFFGHPAEDLRSEATVIPCAVCDAEDLTGDMTGDPVGNQAGNDRPLWIEGDAGAIVIEGGATGSPEAPVLLVIDGDLVIGADTTIHGLMHVRGNWLPGAGSLSVRGAVIIEGAVREPAGLVLEYDGEVLERLAIRGPYARIAGSWSDF